MAARFIPALTVFVVSLSGIAAAQTAAPKPPAVAPRTTPQGFKSSQMTLERAGSHLRFVGQVELEHDSGVKFFADEADLDTETNIVTAKGNVVVTNVEGRISAERLEFNTRTQTGTFYQASGIISLGPKAERVQFGNQDPDIYFYGEKVEKIGER